MENNWTLLLVFAVLALAAILGMVRQYRASAAKRWRAVLDAYAEREIGQAHPGLVSARAETVSSIRQASQTDRPQRLV